MSGEGEKNANDDEEGDADNRRELEGGDSDMSNQWWTELSNSLDTIQKSHPNVATFLIPSQGHCSFGLYYPLQVEGFEAWASSVFEEDRFLGATNHASFPLFVASVFLGAGLLVAAVYASKKEHRIISELNDEVLLLDQIQTKGEGSWLIRLGLFVRSLSKSLLSVLSNFGSYPVTAAYGLSVTFYFWTMLFTSGFVHPLNNPTLGPGAISLSSFGMNNPSLIVYDHEIFRLATSFFLCSGVLTYVMMTFCLWKYVKKLEQSMADVVTFALSFLLIALGSNLVYGVLGNGASCSGVSVVLGLNALQASIESRRGRVVEVYGMISATMFFFILTVLCFPFDSWIMLVSATVIGIMLPMIIFNKNGKDNKSAEEMIDVEPMKMSSVKLMPLKVLLALYLVLFFTMLSGIRHPNEKYREPYLTGCQVMFSDELDNLVNYDFDSGNEEQGGRWLSSEDKEENQRLCAQFCIPNIVARPFGWGANRLFDLTIQKGMCESVGYNDHFADKTFNYMSYSLDVELYFESEQDD